MPTTNEDFARLMYDTYMTAAVKNGHRPEYMGRISWEQLEPENRDAFREAALAVSYAVRHDEQAKYDVETSQHDLGQIMKALDIPVRPDHGSPHEVVVKEVLPRIRKLKATLGAIKEVTESNFVQVKHILEE